MNKNDLKDVYRMRMEGKSIQEIADHYGVTRQRASQYIKNAGHYMEPIGVKCVYRGLREWMVNNRVRTRHLYDDLYPYGCGNATAFSYRLQGRTEFKITEIKEVLAYTGLTFEEAFGEVDET